MIGQRIKTALRSSNKSVADLAKFLDITEQSVYRYTRDEVEPSVSTIFKIAEFTGYSYLYFISRKASPHSGVKSLVIRVDGDEAFTCPIETGHEVTIEIR